MLLIISEFAFSITARNLISLPQNLPYEAGAYSTDKT